MRKTAAHALAFDPETLLRRIGTGKSSRSYRNKEIVFSQEDPADAVFYLQTGKVKLTVVSARGKEAVIGVLERGSFFGEGCLAGQVQRMSTVGSSRVDLQACKLEYSIVSPK